MKFSDPNRSVLQFYSSDTPAFPPPTGSIDASKALEFADGTTSGNRFDIEKATENLEIHA